MAAKITKQEFLSEKRYYFFSDVHLGFRSWEEEKEKERKLVSFLERIRNDAGKIYILGDLFDCWIEYRKVVPKGYYRTLAALNEIVEQGTEINFFSGNHDFWLNKYLQDDVGLKMHRSYLETELDGKKFYLAHGDGLSKGDIGYKIIKKILRNRFNQFLYSLVHPDIGIWLAQGSSRKSRFHTDEKADGDSGMKEFAEKKINEGFDYVIMGHIHRPQNIGIKNGTRTGYYITLGDWIKSFSYGEYSKGAFELKKWS
jgi:UDP-2,3-diacylglucosamine hydrolase